MIPLGAYKSSELPPTNPNFDASAALQVLIVFKTAPELCKLLKTVKEEYMKARDHSLSRLDSFCVAVLSTFICSFMFSWQHYVADPGRVQVCPRTVQPA